MNEARGRKYLQLSVLISLAILSGLGFIFYSFYGNNYLAISLFISLFSIPVLHFSLSLTKALATVIFVSPVRASVNAAGRGSDSREFAIVIPVILRNLEDVSAALTSMKANYESDLPPGTSVILLVDLFDSPFSVSELDAILIKSVSSGIEELNAKNEGLIKTFYVLFRNRRYSRTAGCWMGWERKRGKVVEFFHAVRGDESTSFGLIGVPNFTSLQYVLVVDRDCRLTNGAAYSLLSHASAYSLHLSGQNVRRPSIVTPRLAHRDPADPSVFYLLNEAHASSTRDFGYQRSFLQDFIGEGMYYGKGLIHIDSFVQCTEKLIRDDTVLSHDHLEGLLCSVLYASDVIVTEENPNSWPQWAKRQARWVKGDFLLLPWILGLGILRPHVTPRLSYFKRWLLAENLINHLNPVLLFSGVVASLLLQSFFFAICTLLISIAFLNPGLVISPITKVLAVITKLSPKNTLSAELSTALLVELRRSSAQLAYLCGNSVTNLLAISASLYCLLGSSKHVLEWDVPPVRQVFRDSLSLAIILLVSLLVSVNAQSGNLFLFFALAACPAFALTGNLFRSLSCVDIQDRIG